MSKSLYNSLPLLSYIIFTMGLDDVVRMDRRGFIRVGGLGLGAAVIPGCGGEEDGSEDKEVIPYGQNDSCLGDSDCGDNEPEEKEFEIDPSIRDEFKLLKYELDGVLGGVGKVNDSGQSKVRYKTADGDIATLLLNITDIDAKPLKEEYTTKVRYFSGRSFDAFVISIFDPELNSIEGKHDGRYHWMVLPKSAATPVSTRKPARDNGNGTETRHDNLAGGIYTLDISAMHVQRFETEEEQEAAEKFRKWSDRITNPEPRVIIKEYGCFTAAEVERRKDYFSFFVTAGQFIPGAGQILGIINAGYEARDTLVDLLHATGLVEKDECLAFQQYGMYPREMGPVGALAFTDCLGYIPRGCKGERPEGYERDEPENELDHCDSGDCRDVSILVENGTGSGNVEEYETEFNGRVLGGTVDGTARWNLQTDPGRPYNVKIIGLERQGDERACAVTIEGARISAMVDMNLRNLPTPEAGLLYEFSLGNGVEAAVMNRTLDNGRIGVQLLVTNLEYGDAAEFQIIPHA